MVGQEVQGLMIRLEATTAQLRQEMDKADASVTKATGRIDTQLGKVDSAFDRAGKSALSAANVLKGAFAVALGGVGVGEIIAQAEAYTTIANRLKLVTSSSAEFTAAQQAVFSIAQKAGQPLGATAELYQRIAQNQAALKLSGAGVAGIVETISKTMVISGTSAQSAEAALVQLGQAFASGTLRGEELNAILEQAPALAQAIAQGMGKTVGDLRSLGEQGKLTADSVVKALQTQGAAIDELFAKMQGTVGAGLTRIGTSFTRIVGETDSLTKSSATLAGALTQAAQAMDAIQVPEAFALLKEHADTLAMVLNVTLFAALGKVAGGLAVSAGATLSNVAAQGRLALANQVSAATAVRRAEMDLVAAKNAIELARMNLALAVSTKDVALAEKALAAAKGNALTLSTVLAAARAKETAANAAAAASTTAWGLAMKVATTAATGLARVGSSLLALVGGPVGLLFMAGAAALSFVDWSDKSKNLMGDLGDLGKSVDSVRLEFNKLNEDQQRAQINTWKDKQLGATLAVDAAYKDLKESMKSALVDLPNPDMPDLAKLADQSRAYDAIVAKLNAAKASGQALGPVLREAAASGQISPAQLKSWENQAGVVQDAMGVVNQINERLDVQTQVLAQNTAGVVQNNAAKAGFTTAGEKYLGTLQKQLAGLQDGGSAVKEANRYLAEHAELSDEDRVAITSAAAAIDANKEATKNAQVATKSSTSAAKAAATESKNQENALKDLKAQADIAISSASGLAAAYLAGTDKTREFTLQQKVAEALLKTGAGAHDEVVAKLTAEMNAQDKLNISKAAFDLGQEAEDLLAQAKATLMGADALAAYNVQKAMTIALSGKKIAVDSEEYKQLKAVTEEQLKNNKAMESAGRIEGIIDRLNPEIKLLKDYRQAQEDINNAMLLAPGNTALYQDALVKLGNEYEVNRSKATLWGQMTEGAIDRIDEAFATAWGNIGDGANTLWDNLKKGFKQTLGEIAHMLTTKPLLASISNWLTGTDNGQGLSSVWGKLLGSAGGSSSESGGGMFSGLAGIGKNLYSVWNAITGVGAEVASGYASGGVSGAISGGAGYYGNMISNISSTLSNGFSSLASTFTGVTAAQTAATLGAEGITSAVLSGAVTEGATAIGAQFTTGVATTTAATYAAAEAGAAATAASLGGQISAAMSSAAAMWPLAVVMGMYQSGKLYSAGVRPDAGEMWDSAGSTALGKAAMLPQTVGAKYFEVTDNILGKVVGGKMAAILSGSTLFQAVWSKVGSKLFGSGYETKDSGISLGVEGGVLDAQQYIKQKKKGGLLSGSSKTRFLYNDLDEETSNVLGAKYNEVVLGAGGLFTALGIQLNESVLDGLNMASRNISTKDATPEWIQQQLDFFFAQLGDAAVIAISNATDAGLSGFSYVGLQAFVKNLQDVNGIIGHLNIGLYDMSVSGGFMAEQLSAWAGGIEALRTSAAGYYDKFYTDAEKAANTLSDVRKEFENLGITLPESRQGYRDMVEGIDKTTEAGRAMLLTLMSLSGDASTAFDILESNANTATEAAKTLANTLAETLNAAVTGAMGAVQRAVAADKEAATKAYNARVTSLNDMVSTATENVSGLTSVGNDLSAALKALRGDTDDAVKMLRAQAQATLQSALATARSGGSLSGITGLSDALDTVGNNNTDLYGSMEDFARDQGRTANVVAELNVINGKQLTTEERVLSSLQDQIKQAKYLFEDEMKRFDDQLAFAQAQLDALNGIDNSVISVTAALSGLSSAITAALAAKPAGSAAANTPANNSTLLDAVYQSVLGRDVDAAGAAYWGGLLQSGGIDYAGLVAAITKDAKANGEIKGHAAGGLITGPGTGTSDSILRYLSNGEYVLTADATRTYGVDTLDKMNAGQLPAFAIGGGVTEAGPQLEVTGPSRIYSTNQAASMLKGGGDPGVTAADLKTLIDIVRVGLNEIAKSSKQTSDNTGQIAEVGVQVNNTVQTKVLS